MDKLRQRLRHVADSIRGSGGQFAPEIADRLQDADRDIETLLNATGDPELILGLINEMWVQYAMDPSRGGLLLWEMLDNLAEYTHPADIIYNVHGEHEVPPGSQYAEVVKTNQYVGEMYRTERDQHSKHEMLDSALLPCPRCKSKSVTINLRQLRGGDEGMTRIYTCDVCGWRTHKNT